MPFEEGIDNTHSGGFDRMENLITYIICYNFPPSPGVGGRRWIKHTKYLIKAGKSVKVIAAKPYPEDTSPWDEDLKGIPVHYLPRRYPRALARPTRKIMDRISFRLCQMILPLFTKGTIYDRSIFWKSCLFKELEPAIQSGKVKAVIATGAPFHILYYVALLKEKYSSIRFIADMRDPWLSSHTYGIKNLSSKQFQYEKTLEEHVVSTADAILVPVEEMQTELSERYSNFRSKFKLLPHGYDPEEIPVQAKRKNSTTLKLIYFGTLYEGLDDSFRQLSSVLVKMKGKVRLDIFSSQRRYYRHFVECHAQAYVNYQDPIPSRDLFSRMSHYDAMLMLQPLFGADIISTKFYETIYSRTPILLISNKGKAAHFLKQNNLGVHVEFSNVEYKLSNIFKNRDWLELQSSFDVSQYSFERLTQGLIQIIR